MHRLLNFFSHPFRAPIYFHASFNSYLLLLSLHPLSAFEVRVELAGSSFSRINEPILPTESRVHRVHYPGLLVL